MRFGGVLVGAVIGASVAAAVAFWFAHREAPAAPRVSAAVADSPQNTLNAELQRRLAQHAAEQASAAVPKPPAPALADSALHSAEPPVRTAAQERDELKARVEQSGNAPPEFLTLSRAVEKDWSALLQKEEPSAKLSPWRCYRGGCVASVTHKGIEHTERLAAEFSKAESFHAWPGGKFRSGTVPNAAGEPEVTWILFAPEASPEK
jgi:hypothetical protein